MKNIFFISLLCFTLTSCAQVKNIKQAQAFYYVPVPGTIAVDENGVPIKSKKDTVITIYLEIEGKTPEWENAWKGARSFTIVPTAIKGDTVTIGAGSGSNEKVRLTGAKGNTLWELQLVPGSDVKVPQPIKGNEILLQGKINNSSFFYRVTKVKELASPEFM